MKSNKPEDFNKFKLDVQTKIAKSIKKTDASPEKIIKK